MKLKGTPFERFAQQVERLETGCWVWNGKFTDNGYPLISIKGKWVRAHRFAFECFRHPIPEGLTLDHLCKNTRCSNPFHLEPVTLSENLRRGNGIAVRNAKKTHCPQGHPYTEENTLKSSEGQGRKCKACHRELARRRTLSP